MSTHNNNSYQDPKNINLRGGVSGTGLLRWDPGAGNLPAGSSNWAANPFESTDYGLYINTAGQLVFSSLGSTTVLGAAGGGGASTWVSLFAANTTFQLAGTTFTIDNNTGNNNVLTLTNSGAGSGVVLQITNGGSGADIAGTSDTWQVLKTGAATFLSLASATLTGVGTGLLIEDTAANVITIGANTNTITMAKATTFSTSATFSGAVVTGTASNTVPDILETNNTISTYGHATASAGQVVFRSTSLTTGDLLKLQLTGATLTTGFFIDCYDVTAAGSAFTVGANGATTITGSAFGTAALTVTAGDIVITSGKLLATSAGTAATANAFTNNSIVANTLLAVAGSGTFTGTTTTSFVTITPSGLTSGTAVYIPVAAMTTGTGLSIVAATANFTTGGILLNLSSVAAVAGNLLKVATTGAYTGTGMIIASAGAMTTGVMLSLTSTTGLTSGSLIRATSSTAGAIATNGAISFTATGAFTVGAVSVGFVSVQAASTAAGTIMSVTGGALTTGIGLYVADAGTGITSGSLVYVTTATTGAVATNGVVSINASGNYTSTSNVGLLSVLANSTTAGTVAYISGTALTTGNALYVNSTGTYTGTGLVTLKGSGTTTGTILSVTAAAATLTTGFYFAANDGALNVLTVGSNGHITSNQTTAPTIAVGTQDGITAAAITAGSTDVCGTVTTTGTSTGGTIFTVTFNATYTVAPKAVILTPANANAAAPNTMPYVSSITATTFVVTIPGSGTYAATPSYKYLVVA